MSSTHHADNDGVRIAWERRPAEGDADAMTELLGAMKRMPTNQDLVDYYKQRA